MPQSRIREVWKTFQTSLIMPDIKLKNQPFDLSFHPTEPVLYASLLTGEVKAFQYDDTTGESSGSASWSVRPTKRTARAVDCSEDGTRLWMGGKAGGLFELDPKDGALKSERLEAHESPINRVYSINEQLLATGDDDGVIKFWDPRQEESIRSYSQHFDYISDFCFFGDKKQLVTTSGDGHISVIDIRSNKATPLQVSDDQEDELLSVVAIKGDSKAIVGSTTGILTIWDRSRGWGDCVDRIPGHPDSVDAMVALTPDIVATGSEDGMIRVIQVLPHKFLGVIATHDDYPIERMELDRRKKWLGSVSHDECIKLTDVEDLFEDSEEEGEGQEDEPAEADEDNDGDRKKKKKNGKAGMGDLNAAKRDKDDTFFDDL
ncbi:WD40-repeat-containing domain protein [Kockovaella imperatae]|uniref:WD repeat-containing protein n=1 Tax=Kockovaella imperatae TaxID=4999 RepID=A0A1Y1UAA1_9TREE|nr:WD40-repeat-containing domain protein [Kockovaella imperatae]ORX34958.1 WD40-repeat-containing domain protein [Kockovaella imperatae]